MTKRFGLTSAAVLLLLVGLIVFRDFVFGNSILLYKDIGSDSLNSYYPYLVLFSRYIRAEGVPLWSFSVAMGQSLFPDIGVLLFNPAAWFAKDAIAYLLVYQHLALTLVAGLFFFKFLTLRGLAFCASLLGALLFAFSAYMVMGSCWTVCADELLCVAFALFAIENALVRGKWIYLPLAVALFALITVFHVYLGALFIGAYAFARFFTARHHSLGTFRGLFFIAAVGALGVGLAAIVWLDSLIAILGSSRGSTGSLATKLFSAGLFALETPRHYATAVLRAYANDMFGNGDHFRGWSNYFEAPLSYCGLLSLVMLPQVLVRASTRQRIVTILFLGGIVLATIFPWFRHLFYAFQGDYYRAFSLFSVTGIIILSVTAFSRYLRAERMHIPLLVGTTILLLALLYSGREMQVLLDHSLQRIATVGLIAYALLLSLGKILRRAQLFGSLVLALTVIELCYFNWLTVSGSRDVVTKQDLAQRIGYNDHTIEALRAINAQEKPFFRVSKLYSSGLARHPSLNDSFIFDYFGTTSYLSFPGSNYINFLITAGALPDDHTKITLWSAGLLGHPLLATFACEKYILSQENVPAEERHAYEEAGQFGDVFAFRNTLSVPFGLFFENAVSVSAVRQLSQETKAIVLMQKAVLESGAPASDPVQLLRDAETQQIPDLVAAHRETGFQIDSFRQSYIQGKISCPHDGYVVFQTMFDPGWRILVDDRRVTTMRIDGGLLGIRINAGEHALTLRYLPPSLYLGGTASAISLLLFGFAAWRWPRYRISAAPK